MSTPRSTSSSYSSRGSCWQPGWPRPPLGHLASPLFAAPFLSFDTGINPSSVAVGDLNADGKPDLRASRGSSSRSDDSWGFGP